MRKTLKYFLIAIVVIATGGIIWWQYNKKDIVKKKIENAVIKGTDSTYYIKYDSSKIDAIAGNASFFNIVLQSDSLQKELYANDTSGFSKTIFNVHIGRLNISGANIPSFLQKNTIEANRIEIIRPVITIINMGKEEPKKFTAADTLALYEKITGKFKSIQAKEIFIVDAAIAFAKGKKSPHSTLQGLNITLRNLKIDSTKNYDNIISYFVKDVVATINKVTVKNDKTNHLFIFENIEYNAAKRFFAVKKIVQSNISNGKNLIILTNNKVSGLSTNAFIIHKQINADSITTDGGALNIYRKRNQAGGSETIEIDNDFFNEAIVKNIRIGNTTLTVYNNANQTEMPFVLKNVQFNATNIDSIYTGTNILKLLGQSQWDFSAKGFTYATKDNIYNINIGPFVIDKSKKQIVINNVSILPAMSELAFVKSLKYQTDLFNVNLKNIVFSGVDMAALSEKQSIIAETLTLQPTIKVFNDRLVTPDTASKVGKYPQQGLLKLTTPVYIKKVNVINGYVSYRERGAISKNVGDVFFTDVNGELTNVTNIQSYINQNSLMMLNVKTKFLNTASITSLWKMPMNVKDGAFSIAGKVDGFDGRKLNPVIEPLGMGSVKSGNIKSYTFNLRGNDFKGEGEAVLLYNNLKINLLKNTNDAIKNKSVTSFVANIFIKDKNPTSNITRTAKINFDRVITKSFFNLVWKSLFDGAKKSIR